MRITSIEVTGWMPFAGTFKLELPAGPIAVVGMHAGDERRSNRAGKTALLEAITWCLFGVHRKRLDDSVINRSVSACEVTVVLGDITARRSRTRGSSTKLVVSTSYSELVGEAAQTELSSVIGLGLEDYLATSCFRQGDVESIIARTAGERLALVSEWLQQSRWMDARKLQAAKTSAADTVLVQRRSALENAALYLLSAADRKLAEEQLQVLNASLETLGQSMQALTDQMLESIDAKSQLEKYRELATLRARLAQLRQKLTERAEAVRLAQVATERAEVASFEARTTRAAVAELVQFRDVGFDGACPVMCQACPVAADVTKEVRKASSLLASRTDAYSAARATWETAEVERVNAARTASIFASVAAQYQQTTETGKQIASSLTLSEAEAAAAPSAVPMQEELHQARARFEAAAKQIGELERLLEAGEQSASRHDGLALAVAAAEADAKVAHLALRAISSVPARIAAQQLGELEQEANLLLQGSGVSLRFSWARELADKAAVCEECGFVFPSKRGDECPSCQAARGKKRAQELELLCDDGSGVEEDARYNSGGTRAIVGSAIRLAASAMLRRLRSSRAAWAIVDEPFGSLDAENREQLARTFAGMLGSVGLEQALVVSHDPALLAALPSRIVIDKDGSSSTARIE